MAYASWALKVFLKSSLNWLRVSSVGLASPWRLRTTLSLDASNTTITFDEIDGFESLRLDL
nr:hypothetical protein [Tanacetum cinerariifolium]